MHIALNERLESFKMKPIQKMVLEITGVVPKLNYTLVLYEGNVKHLFFVMGDEWHYRFIPMKKACAASKHFLIGEAVTIESIRLINKSILIKLDAFTEDLILTCTNNQCCFDAWQANALMVHDKDYVMYAAHTYHIATMNVYQANAYCRMDDHGIPVYAFDHVHAKVMGQPAYETGNVYYSFKKLMWGVLIGREFFPIDQIEALYVYRRTKQNVQKTVFTHPMDLLPFTDFSEALFRQALLTAKPDQVQRVHQTILDELDVKVKAYCVELKEEQLN